MSFKDEIPRGRSDSLFCTPPPDDHVSNDALAGDSTRVGEWSDGGVGVVSPGGEYRDSLFRRKANPDTASRRTDDRKGIRQSTTLAQGERPSHIQEPKDAIPEAPHREQQAMTSRSGSLTTLGETSNASTATAGNYLATYSSTLPYPFTTHSLSTYSSPAPIHRSFDVPPANLPTAQLIDYSSSEEEAETQQVRVPERCRTRTRKKQETKRYKCAEFTDSESGDSDTDTSEHQQRSRKDFPQRFKQTTPSKKKAASTIPDKMVRMDSYTWGASTSSKKRPLPPSPPPASAKRSKQSPFVVESSSEDDRGSDDDDGHKFDRHNVRTPGQPARRGIGELGSDIIPPTSSLQRYGSNTALEGQTMSKTSTVQPSKALNKGRFNMLMAMKLGRATAPNPKLKSPLPTTSPRTDLRDRPLNTTQPGSSQQDVHSPVSETTPMRLQGGRPTQTVHGKIPGQGEGPLQLHRSQIQDPGSIHSNNLQARIQGPSASTSNLTIPRKANATRPQNAANSSSLRNILDTAKAEHRGAAQEPDNIGSEWRTAQAERASSAKPVKNAHRPEVGARYGHTLTARKSNTQERESASSKGAPATTGIKAFQTSVSKSRVSSPAVSLASASKQTQSSSSKAPLAPNSTPSLIRTPAVDLRQFAQNTRQGTTTRPANERRSPVIPRNRTQLAPDVFVEQANDIARSEVAERLMRRAPSPYSIRASNASPPDDGVASQGTVTPNQVQPIASPNGLPQSSMGLVSKAMTRTSEEQPDQRLYATDTGQVGSAGAYPNQQAATPEPNLLLTRLNSLGRVMGAEDSQSQSTSSTVAAAQFRHSTTDADSHGMAPDAVEEMDILVEKCVAHASGIPDPPAASTKPGAKSMPVAVMIRPDRSGAQASTRHASGKSTPTVAPVVGRDTSQTESLAGTAECLQPSSDEHAAETDKDPTTYSSLALKKDENVLVSEAPEPTQLSSGRSSSPVLRQSAERTLETAVDAATSDHKPVGPTGLVEAAPSQPVDNTHDRQDPSASSTSRVTQSAAWSHESASHPPGTDAEIVQIQRAATTVPQLITTEASSPQPMTARQNSTDAEGAPIELLDPTAASEGPAPSLAHEIALPSPTISPTAEPYFEYSIHQSLSSSSSSTTTTEISAQPFTTLDSANSQTSRLFQSAKQQYEILGMQCELTTTKVLDDDLSVHEGVFISIEDPSKILTLRLWVERAEVSVYANTPSPTSTSLLISKTLYALRLWRLVEEAADSDSEDEDEDEDGNEEKEKELIRIYHPLPHICTELHTSLESANRAARRVQIELSHEKEPKSLQAKWQTENLRKLNEKLADLGREFDEVGEDESGSPGLFKYEEGRGRGCWRSVFDGFGLGSYKFELLVTSVRVSGPRNL